MLNRIEFQSKPVSSLAVRYFQPKSYPMDDGTYRGDMPRRFGYEAHHHTRGLLPRLKLKEKRVSSMPITSKEDPWSNRLAREGENDFIKILGDDEDFKQYELLTHVPDWLRGYKNTNLEYTVLMKKRQEFSHWKYSKPLKWKHMQQRIRYLYKRINNKYKPPEVEKLRPSGYVS